MTGPLLDIQNLSVHFGAGEGALRAVQDVSLRIDAGESVALVGESGSGKSVTALSVMQLLPYPRAHHPRGRIRFKGQELVGAPVPVLGAIRGGRVGMIFQEPMTSLNPLHTVEKQIGESLLLHGDLRGARTRERTLELLEMVGIPDPARRLRSYPHQLSGGQRQRVMIAMAIANEPELLIADEPTTALDVTIQAQILALLRDLQSRLGMALLLITHDLAVVRKMVSRIYVMSAGTIVESGSVEDIFTRPQHPYTRGLLAAEPRPRTVRSLDGARPLMTAHHLRVWFPVKAGLLRRTVDHIRAVDDVSLTLREGRTVGLVGESGSGKTTLGLALLRLERSRGSIVFDGRELQGLRSGTLRPLRREMQMVFQDPYGSLSPRMSVAQIVEEGLRVHRLGTSAAEREALITRALEEVHLDPESRHRYPHEFSGGQRQRIAIARAMVLKPRLVVLDEPTSALDRSVQTQIIELLRELQSRHRLAYLFISHDLSVVRALSDEIVVMRDGRVVERGPPDRVFEHPEAPYTRTLMAAAFDLEAPPEPSQVSTQT